MPTTYLEDVDVYLSVWRAIEDQMVWKKVGPLRNSRRSMGRNGKEEKRRRTTVDRAVRELAESFRIRIGEKGGLKVGRAVRRLTKHAIPSKQICIVLCDVLPQLQRPRLASVRHRDTRNKQLIKCNFISGTRVRAHTSLSLSFSLCRNLDENSFSFHT